MTDTTKRPDKKWDKYKRKFDNGEFNIAVILTKLRDIAYHKSLLKPSQKNFYQLRQVYMQGNIV